MGKITMARTPHAQTAWSVFLYTVTIVCTSLQLITHGVQLSSCGDPETELGKFTHLGIMVERYILFLKRSSHAQQIPMAANLPSANDTSHRGSQQDLGPNSTIFHKKLHDLEWNVVAFAPVSSITLCANTILEVSAICF